MAEELFSYPVKTSLPVKSSVKSVMPPIPSFAKAVKGAGFTRAFVVGDGVRRRIDLVQEFNGFWYLQLSFAPLVNYLGNPAIELKKTALFFETQATRQAAATLRALQKILPFPWIPMAACFLTGL
jgi:adenylate cyclase